jgi:hypothetical protein
MGRYQGLRERVGQLRGGLVRSVLRAFYMGFMGKGEIVGMGVSLGRVEEGLMNSLAMPRVVQQMNSNGQGSLDKSPSRKTGVNMIS